MIVNLFNRRGEPCAATRQPDGVYIGVWKVSRVRRGFGGTVQVFFERDTIPLTLSIESFRKLAPLGLVLPVASKDGLDELRTGTRSRTRD